MLKKTSAKPSDCKASLFAIRKDLSYDCITHSTHTQIQPSLALTSCEQLRAGLLTIIAQWSRATPPYGAAKGDHRLQSVGLASFATPVTHTHDVAGARALTSSTSHSPQPPSQRHTARRAVLPTIMQVHTAVRQVHLPPVQHCVLRPAVLQAAQRAMHRIVLQVWPHARTGACYADPCGRPAACSPSPLAHGVCCVHACKTRSPARPRQQAACTLGRGMQAGAHRRAPGMRCAADTSFCRARTPPGLGCRHVAGMQLA